MNFSVFRAEHYLGSDKDSGIDTWFYIICNSHKEAIIMFINYWGKHILEDYLDNMFIEDIKPIKKLGLWKIATTECRWKIRRLPSINYSGRIKGIKTDLADMKFSYKW